ncbi:restriction endonuclease subunit S [Empedobacter falsenii]
MREDWVECTFEDVIENISTSNYKIKQKDYTSNSEIPVVDQGQELIGGYFNNKENIIPVELPVVVFGDHTKCVKYINFHFVPGADGTKVLKVDDNISTKYIYYLLKVLVFKIEDKGYARHFQFLQKELIPLPPLPEQRTIVKKIEALFSSLDTGIADLKKAQDQLKIYRQAVLKKAFEGELTKEWRENDVINKVTLKEILSLSSSKHKAEKPEGLFYIGLEHIEKDSGKLTEHVGIEEIKTVKNKFEANNILYGKLRPYLNKVYFSKESGVCSTDILVFKISEKVIGKFIHLFMLSREFVNDMSNNTSGVNLPRVSTKYIENYLVPLPSIEEQNQIVKEIESRLSVCDAVEQQIKESLSQAEALRQSILKKAFEGTLLTEEEIDACKQEPHYEPASILLEKIKAEKEANKPAKKKTTKKKTTE